LRLCLLRGAGEGGQEERGGQDERGVGIGRGQEVMEVGGGSKGITSCRGEVIGTGRSGRAASRGGWFSSFSAP